MNGRKNILTYFIFVLIGAMLGSYLTHQFLNWKSPVIKAQANIPGKTILMFDKNNPIVEVVKKIGPAVVNIDTKHYVKIKPFSNEFDEFFKNFFGESSPFENAEPSRIVPQTGLGSGVIISGDGLVLTNEHVIHQANEINVTLSDKRKFKGKVIGADNTLDLAIVKIEAKNLPYAQLGDSDKLQVGEWVIAIGNPYGYDHTVTVGVLSGKGREISDETKNYENLLQTDAAINRGNSGGPLINVEGKVIGINTAIIPFAQGIGFAIPVNTAKLIKEELIAHHKIIRPYLGIGMQEMSEDIAKYLKMPKIEGILITSVLEGAPAEKSGLQRGDVILEIEHKKVNNPQELRKIIQEYKPNDKITLVVWKDGALKYFRVVLEEKPSNF
ncbi:MAG: trypsin-like peptidase domain-containing protein [Armatimonadetes bacterium]|nr:trypsin-like peptidase domain-containing protein [Armatimonadota bacterium]